MQQNSGEVFAIVRKRLFDGLPSEDRVDEVLAWVRAALRTSRVDEKQEHEAAVARLQDEYNRLQGRIDTMYVDKLDGRIDAAYFDRMAAQWRDEQGRCLRDIERHQNANRSCLDEGIHLLELAQSARRLFDRQEAHEKRRLLDFVVSNCFWKGGELTVDLRQPFDILAKAKTASAVAEGALCADPGKSEIWLGDLDTHKRDHKLLESLTYREKLVCLGVKMAVKTLQKCPMPRARGRSST